MVVVVMVMGLILYPNSMVNANKLRLLNCHGTLNKAVYQKSFHQDSCFELNKPILYILFQQIVYL